MALKKKSQLLKSPTGIQGLDEILGGGLPAGRPTLVCGSAGCGKTLMAMEFLVRGVTQYDEPGVFIAFEETTKELTQNVASLGFDLESLIARKKLFLDYVQIERSEIEETGEYNLDGLFIRLQTAIDTVHAKRVVLDTVESLFTSLPNPLILRAELRRLFRWLKTQGVTAIITGERGEGTLTRQGLEEYVSDCVIVLDHRVNEQNSTRRLRVVKYRGSMHGTNEYPFLIDQNGIMILPITSVGLQSQVSNERIPTGIARLDAMLSGKGFYRGTTILLSGTAGSGKSSVSAHFANATCARHERVLYFAFEESANQIIRNMRSIGLDLAPWVKQGLLKFNAVRPTLYGLENHLSAMHKAVHDFKPHVVIIDPINSFVLGGNETEVKAMLLRLVDFLKMNQITVMMTSLTAGDRSLEHTDVAISSLIDTWLLVRNIELAGERNRALYVLKSRGMAHSNQLREFVITDHGIELRDVYLGAGGLLTGSARLAQETQEQADKLTRQQTIELKELEFERKRQAMEAKITALRADFQAEQAETMRTIKQDQAREVRLTQDRTKMATSRQADLKGNQRSQK